MRARPERVWRCVTSARELCSWWTERAETDARNGGRLRLVWPATADEPQREARGAFVDLDPGRKAAVLWAAPARGVPPLVTFFIEPRRGGSTVTVLHAGFSTAENFDSRFETWRGLWEDCLAKLTLYLEAGRTMKSEAVRLADLDKLRRLRPGMAIAR
ncbi:MAG: SRPBCC domain-containing protein [Elusimicrobia bacterium]|nr:SRPBCC domain-containing protein [Elusimicrobiota bacterium]